MKESFLYDGLDLGLNTFDCLNCQSDGWFFKRIGHTAGVIRMADGSLWVYESTQRGSAGGVQFLPFDEWYAGRTGQVYVRKLIIPDAMRVVALIRSDMHLEKYKNTPYPNLKTRAGRFIMYKAVIDLGRWTENKDYGENWPWFFCTQLYTDWLRYCQLADGFNPAEIEPDNTRPKGTKVTGAGTFEQFLLPGVKMEKEIRIK